MASLTLTIGAITGSVTATTQRASMMLVTDYSVASHSYTTPGETLSNSIIIKGTGTGTGNNDVQMVAFTVGYDPNNT